ncbi:hypothetical protein K438DRAFT_1747891 [Mycena galopus ATCC 62051]|nr:hypothetical protein K438DRAFT_1747891 [Mycena galopus ATCC 62051]
MQLVLRTTDLEVVTQQCHHAKDELKGAKKELIELSGALSRMTASLRELEAEISHKNHMAEDSARTVIVLKQEIKVSNKQIAELGYSRATLRDGMALKITELEEATLQSSMQELETKISSKDHTAEESEQTIVAFQQEIKTTELEQAKDELKKAQKELVELSDALCVESASIQKLLREILRKNIILEDCEEKKMRYLTSQASHEQITELKNSETVLTITITLKTIELEKATWQFGYAEARQKLEGDIVKNIQATTPMPQQGIEVVELVDSEAMSTEAMMLRATELQDLVYDLQHQMLHKDAVVGDLQEQVSEAHSTNSDLLAHNIQLNIHQCHTQFSSFTAISEGTQKTLQVRLKMASEISDAEYSSLSFLIVNLGGFRGMWSGVAPLQPGGFSNDITVGSVGKNRQECPHISLEKENSASPGPPEENEMAMMTSGLRTTALRKKTIERNTGLQWDKPPRKATWSWSHPAPHASVATRVDLHKLSNVKD